MALDKENVRELALTVREMSDEGELTSYGAVEARVYSTARLTGEDYYSNEELEAVVDLLSPEDEDVSLEDFISDNFNSEESLF